jgi:hypothetical protein
MSDKNIFQFKNRVCPLKKPIRLWGRSVSISFYVLKLFLDGEIAFMQNSIPKKDGEYLENFFESVWEISDILAFRK